MEHGREIFGVELMTATGVARSQVEQRLQRFGLNALHVMRALGFSFTFAAQLDHFGVEKQQHLCDD